MTYKTLIVTKAPGRITITFNRLSHHNSINSELIMEINSVLDEAEKDSSCKIVVIEGQNGMFCTGMDFEELIAVKPEADTVEFGERFCSGYIETLKRFSMISKVIISKIDGQVMAGGVGIASASDLVIATPRTQFNLSEALWGLLPAMVLPYLIRRVGYQKAFSMTLTTLPVYANSALDINLVDEISEDPEDSIKKLSQRLMKIEDNTIKSMKKYFRKLWIINDETEKAAVSEISKLVTKPEIRENIRNFVLYKKFPWDKKYLG